MTIYGTRNPFELCEFHSVSIIDPTFAQTVQFFSVFFSKLAYIIFRLLGKRMRKRTPNLSIYILLEAIKQLTVNHQTIYNDMILTKHLYTYICKKIGYKKCIMALSFIDSSTRDNIIWFMWVSFSIQNKKWLSHIYLFFFIENNQKFEGSKTFQILLMVCFETKRKFFIFGLKEKKRKYCDLSFCCRHELHIMIVLRNMVTQQKTFWY